MEYEQTLKLSSVGFQAAEGLDAAGSRQRQQLMFFGGMYKAVVFLERVRKGPALAGKRVLSPPSTLSWLRASAPCVLLWRSSCGSGTGGRQECRGWQREGRNERAWGRVGVLGIRHSCGDLAGERLGVGVLCN